MYIKLSDENTRFIKLNVNKLKNNEFLFFILNCVVALA